MIARVFRIGQESVQPRPPAGSPLGRMSILLGGYGTAVSIERTC
jgi:hypothetical protein